MKMLLLPPYFFPEQTASTHLDQDRFDTYKLNEISTMVYAPQPTRGIDSSTRNSTPKRETMFDSSVEVRRFSLFKEGRNPILRAIRYVIGNIKQYLFGCSLQDIDIIYSGSTPPTQGILCGLVKKKLRKKTGRYIPFVYCLQDIFPDSLVNAGMTKENSLLWKIGRKIENYTYKNADKIIVISEGFKNNIVRKGVPESKIEIISNWIDLDLVNHIPRNNNQLIEEFGLNPDKFIVVYAGNFGAAQGADIVIKAAEQLINYDNIQFVIFGGGAYFADAKKEAEGMKNIFIHNLLPQNRVSEVYSLGDVSLITCKAGTGNAGLPSKTWSIMGCETPIIASFDVDSDLASVIKNAGAGECVEPESVDELANAILRMYQNRNKNYCSLREYVKNNASKEVCVGRYVEVFKKVTGEK